MKKKHPVKHVKKRKTISRKITSLEDLEHAELSGIDTEGESLEASSTDEDEKEGSGDGRIGKSREDIFKK